MLEQYLQYIESAMAVCSQFLQEQRSVGARVQEHEKEALGQLDDLT
jgi:hypothetical protein